MKNIKMENGKQKSDGRCTMRCRFIVLVKNRQSHCWVKKYRSNGVSRNTYNSQFEKEVSMSKYDALWNYIQKSTEQSFKLTFDEIGEIARVPLDHSFLNYKKELNQYGWQVGKISMKEQTVVFEKVVE